MKKKAQALGGRAVAGAALSAFKKLSPRVQARNPVMFVIYLCTAFCTVRLVAGWVGGAAPGGFELQVVAWLWATILFANFSEGLAEAQGRARADSLKAMRKTVAAKRVGKDGAVEPVSSGELRAGDLVECVAGDVIPGDGEVVEGIASVDESAITGESAPVIREAGGDRSGVTGGTKVISDRIVVRITAERGGGFIDKMIAMVEGASRKKSPGEVALSILLSSFTLVFILAVATLPFFQGFVAARAGEAGGIALVSLAALLACLAPTTIGGLLSAIGIAGVSRLIEKNVMALSGRAIEASGDVDTLLLDKTGTITHGNRMATALFPCDGVGMAELARAAVEASAADPTPEGKSLVAFAAPLAGPKVPGGAGSFVPFSARTRMSGVDYGDPARSLRKGSVEAVAAHVAALGGSMPREAAAEGARVARAGGTPLAVAEGGRVLGVVELKDVVKDGVRERFAALRAMGIRTVMITGDNPLTAAAIAGEAGVSDYVAEARPETKLDVIRREQAAGHVVAMVGDGTNDAPALAQADVGIAMASGTQTAREAGNMVDLDNDPSKVIEAVETGKRLLITRGALTTFSVANDIAKYFAVIPAMLAGLYAAGGKAGPLSALNLMGLATPESAILSAVVFNALIIVALVPLALRGAKFDPAKGAGALLRKNLLVYGLGGVVAPFLGIKLIDLALRAIGAV